ncbi:cytochrome-c oxidase [Litchfieldia alkalitelluris]|uniref:cytochrome-c oxidase n=1 Tax=Litchfieldia alkalitelluris TaxID=304268 RepID=UPI0009961863|nr:cytochrome-c oxidase [Litchfieldia alkalitelluris]
MGIRYIKIDAIYFVIGVSMGLYMSIVHSYTLTSVHVHVNLLGWVSMAIIGSLYYLFPSAAASKLAKVQFWLYNIALPIMMIGLAFIVHGNEAFVPAVAAGGTVVVISVILFAINIILNVKPSKSQGVNSGHSTSI